MLLVIDVGNTNIVYGLFERESLLHQFRVESGRGRTSDEYAVVLRQLLSMHRIETSAVDAAIIASVVPPLTEPMVDLVRRAFGFEPRVVGRGVKTGMSILYENPKEVGADRIVNAVAAHQKLQARRGGASVERGIVVVDFGTATTFDCVSPRGEYLGGLIAPGIQISADALFARAAKLPRVEIALPPKVIGRNTVHSMQSGIIYGYVGLVDALIERIVGELGYPCDTLATGGLASLIAPLSRTVAEVDDTLTLVGLRIIHERNVA